MPKLYIVTGMSGAGKTTVARRLQQHGEIAFDSKLQPGLYHFVDATGTVADTVHLQDEAWRRRFKWSLNEAKLDELLQRYATAKRVFLCGRANLFQYWERVHKVFLLEVDKPTLIARLNNPSRDNLFAKDTATQERLAEDLETTQARIARRGAIIIDATASVEKVVDAIIKEASD